MSCVMCSRMMLNVRDAHHQLFVERSADAESIALRKVNVSQRPPATVLRAEPQLKDAKVWDGTV